MSRTLKHSMPKLIYLSVILLIGVHVCAQTSAFGADGADDAKGGQDRMLTPPPVSGHAYLVSLDSEEHANLLRYGLALSSGYSDNVLLSATGSPVSDINYSVWPTIGIDKTTTRLHWDSTYAPGFTFYEHTSVRNEADHNALFNFQYRLSPHVTFSAQDTFSKSSSVFNQPDLAVGSVFGGAQGPNASVIAPIANRLANFGNVGLTYQYGSDDMIGAGGVFSNLYYPDKTQVTGLWDSSSQLGSAFYAHRLSDQNYIGAMYQYGRLISYPDGVDAETKTQSVFLFYTVYPNRRFSLSLFGGPQLAHTVQPVVPSLGHLAFSHRSWSAAGGASLDWEGRFISAALSYAHTVSDGGGLIGAVRLDSANTAVRLRFTRALSASVSGFYGNNKVIGYSLGATNGHTISGTAALQRMIGEHFSVQLGYTRLYQNYSIPVIAGTPYTNREFLSFSYTFARPLGR